MTARVTFRVDATSGKARLGVIDTPRGAIRTPAFMPVGTAATVKAMLPESVAATGADILLGNTYHLMLRPTAERIARLGGLHRFMNWDKPILTDSGGFQVMSLAELRKLTEDGVEFRSHIDGSKHMLSPERSMEIQKLLGSDIVMCFDECPALPADRARIAESMQLSMRWAARSKEAFGDRPGHALFGIQQGGLERDLRAQSAEALRDIGFDGYAVGGLAVGEGQEAMFGVLDYAPDMLPADKPRYLMGVGKPDDIVGAVARGIDMMDCVLPSRSGRTGQAWTRMGQINIKNARHADDPRPLDEDCTCPACRSYSRAYLHHVFRAGEMISGMLLTWHNLRYFQDLMAEMRAAIAAGEACSAAFSDGAGGEDRLIVAGNGAMAAEMRAFAAGEPRTGVGSDDGDRIRRRDSPCGSHRLFADGLVVDLEKLGLVEDEFLPREAGDLVVRRQLDRVAGARLFAHAAVDAAQLVDVELLGVLLAIVPGALLGDDVDAVRRARGRAHEARHAADAAVVVLVQAMHAAEVVAELAALLDGAVVALLLGVLDHPEGVLVLAVATHVLERVPEGRAEASEDLGEEQPLGGVEPLRGHVDDVVVVDRHGTRSVEGSRSGDAVLSCRGGPNARGVDSADAHRHPIREVAEASRPRRAAGSRG